MARKLHAQIRDWLPKIINSYSDYETLNTYEIVKSIGKMLSGLGTAHDQLDEINHVLEVFVNSGLLIPKEKTKVTFWGINFDSIVYEPTQNFIDFVNKSSQIQTIQKKTLEQGKEIIIEQKIININLNIAIEKLLEINPTLKTSIIGF